MENTEKNQNFSVPIEKEVTKFDTVIPYEHIDDWEKFNETTLLENKEFFSDLNMEDITDADYMHTK